MEPPGTSLAPSQRIPQENRLETPPRRTLARHTRSQHRGMEPLWSSPKWWTGCLMLLLSACVHEANGRARQKSNTVYHSFHEKKTDKIGVYPISVSTSGSRPILLLHELNGQSPECFSLAKELSDAGCKVYIPRFYGHAGMDNPITKFPWDIAHSQEWKIFCRQGGTIHETMPRIVAHIHRKHPDEKITVIGNCMTGGQALALLAEPTVETVVVCQPASPLAPLVPGMHRHFGIPQSKQEAGLVALRDHPWKKLVSIHFRSDSAAPFLRTEYLGRWTLRQGCADRHAILVGLAPKQRGLSALSDFHPGWKRLEVRSGARIVHPTVTSADPGDREIFRAALFDVLHLKRSTTDLPASHALETESP